MTAVTPDGDKAKFGRLADVVEVKNQNPVPGSLTSYLAVRLQLPDGEETTALFTPKELERAIKRANKNPEDIPSKGLLGFFRDLVD